MENRASVSRINWRLHLFVTLFVVCSKRIGRNISTMVCNWVNSDGYLFVDGFQRDLLHAMLVWNTKSSK